MEIKGIGIPPVGEPLGTGCTGWPGAGPGVSACVGLCSGMRWAGEDGVPQGFESGHGNLESGVTGCPVSTVSRKEMGKGHQESLQGLCLKGICFT